MVVSARKNIWGKDTVTREDFPTKATSDKRLKWGNKPYKYPEKKYEAYRKEHVQSSWVGTGLVGLEKWPICLEQTEEDREWWMRWGKAT